MLKLPSPNRFSKIRAETFLIGQPVVTHFSLCHCWFLTDKLLVVSQEGHSLCSKKAIPCVRRMTFFVFEEGHSLSSRKDIPEKDIPCFRRRTFLLMEEGYSVCSKQDIPCVPRRTFRVCEAGHSLCCAQEISCVSITNRAHAIFW